MSLAFSQDLTFACRIAISTSLSSSPTFVSDATNSRTSSRIDSTGGTFSANTISVDMNAPSTPTIKHAPNFFISQSREREELHISTALQYCSITLLKLNKRGWGVFSQDHQHLEDPHTCRILGGRGYVCRDTLEPTMAATLGRQLQCLFIADTRTGHLPPLRISLLPSS